MVVEPRPKLIALLLRNPQGAFETAAHPVGLRERRLKLLPLVFPIDRLGRQHVELFTKLSVLGHELTNPLLKTTDVISRRRVGDVLRDMSPARLPTSRRTCTSTAPPVVLEALISGAEDSVGFVQLARLALGPLGTVRILVRMKADKKGPIRGVDRLLIRVWMHL